MPPLSADSADDSAWIDVCYRITASAASIEARAQALALEQSVELPLEAVADPRVRDHVVGRVAAIAPLDDASFRVDVRLAAETTGFEAGQLMNMLFGNSSLQGDVELVDARFPAAFASRFGGPRFGIAGLRELTGIERGPLTCSALKPQGLTAKELADLAHTFAVAGIDIVKDDHGLADQTAAPFAERVRAVQRAIDEANRATGGRTLYAPSLTGSGRQIDVQLGIAREAGTAMVMIAPMISGVASLAALASEAKQPILAHPALAGAARIAPPLLLGKLFRLFGADASIFPNAGGRFGYTARTCADIADAARAPWHGLAPMLPVPAGGMSVERIPEMRAHFGDDTLFLIGGSLLVARDHLLERCRAFVAAVRAR